jgi:hypothetical protein
MPPKGRIADSRAFSLQTGLFWGRWEGAIIAILDPWPADGGWWEKAMAPLWQYFVPLRNWALRDGQALVINGSKASVR